MRYRVLAEDVWPDDPPEDPRASLQSLVSRLRRGLPPGVLEAASGGYRLTLPRDSVDVVAFHDLVAQAQAAKDPGDAAAAARAALNLWSGDPWIPNDAFDWVISDLMIDRGTAERVLAGAPAPELGPGPAVPAALTSLVGRRDELVLIAEQLASSRLVTVIGPGGAGKTTLTLESARAWPDTVLVELAPASVDEVWPAVAAAIGRTIRIAETPAQYTAARTRALESLAGRSVLLVLDNCEHVATQAAAVAHDVLRAVPGSRILATSREPLGLPGEAFVDLGPLPEDDATELFTRRVRAARGRAPDPEEAEVVSRIVRRLDGLPLALELAAAKARTLSLGEIDAGLDDRFTLLAHGPRGADPRHQTLRALIDWSWETLTDPERAALLASSVFPDGIAAADLDVVARHCDTTVSAFEQLVDRSLLSRADGWLRMLETVREYGVDRLRREGRLDRLRAAQARAVAELATRRDAVLRGPRIRDGLAWFDSNEENLGAAVRTCNRSPELRGLGAQVVRSVLWAWMLRERGEELRSGIEAFADQNDPLDTEAAVVVNGLDLLIGTFLAQVEGGEAGLDEVPAGTAELFDLRATRIRSGAARHPSELASALPALLDAVSAALHRPGSPRRIWSTGLDLAPDERLSVPPWTRAFLCVLRALLAQNSGRLVELGRESERAARLFDELGDPWGIALANQMRSEWLMLAGRLDEALSTTDAATTALSDLTSPSDLVQQRSAAVSVLTRLGRLEEAQERIEELDRIAAADGSETTRLQVLLARASVAVAVGDGPEAVRLLDELSDRPIQGPFDQITAWRHSLAARALVLCGRLDDARVALQLAFEPAIRSGDQPIIADVLLGLAAWLTATGDEGAARRALATSVRYRGGLDATEPTIVRLVERLGMPDPEVAVEDASDLVALLDG